MQDNTTEPAAESIGKAKEFGRMEVHPVTLGDTTFFRLDLLWPTSGSGQYGESNVARVAERKDAERIALCWNCHNDLLAACQEADEQFDYMLKLMGSPECGEFYNGALSECKSRLDTLRAAIAKAVGNE